MPLDVPMDAADAGDRQAAETQADLHSAPTWLYNLHVLWLSRILLMRVGGIASVVSVAVALIIPKMYVSQARIMPPEMSGANSALLAALAGRATGNDGLGVLAMSLIGGRNNGALFVDLLQSSSVSGGLIDRF